MKLSNLAHQMQHFRRQGNTTPQSYTYPFRIQQDLKLNLLAVDCQIFLGKGA